MGNICVKRQGKTRTDGQEAETGVLFFLIFALGACILQNFKKKSANYRSNPRATNIKRINSVAESIISALCLRKITILFVPN